MAQAPHDRYYRGQPMKCAACGRDSIVQTKTRLDGWENLGQWFVCGLCGHYLAAIEAVTASSSQAEDTESGAASRLAAFLGTDDVKVDRSAVMRDADRAFCRDCMHFLRHPFVSRCLLHDRVTEPMNDCADLARCPTEADGQETEE